MRLRNRLKEDVNFLIVRVVLGERTTEYMRAYTGRNISVIGYLYNAVVCAYMWSGNETG